MSIFTKLDAAGRTFNGASVGNNVYDSCIFRHCDMQDALVYPGQFFNCDFTHAVLVGSVIKLSCVQGHANKADEMTLYLYLYWIIHFFDTPPEFRARVEYIIGDKLPKIKKIFNMECINLVNPAPR